LRTAAAVVVAVAAAFSSDWELYTGKCQKQDEILTECELQLEMISMHGNDGRGS
jgi:hypothetical protein